MNPDKIFHDLYAPLARAKTITKMLLEDSTDQEIVLLLMQSLEELEVQIHALKDQWKQ